MEKDLPQRKPTRLKNFDYNKIGAYFITICTENRRQILSRIEKTKFAFGEMVVDCTVGEGLAPPEYLVKLRPCGEVVKEQLLALESRYKNVTVEDYVIMPNHIHAIIFLHEEAGGASPSPTLIDVVSAFKSLTSRICKRCCGIEKIFQRSFYDHIIRDREDYEEHLRYIHENPMRWFYDELYTEE
ncbi:MAG: transposase [Clostridia bacterium]|nr:transposase [Clostridia bacterium]